MGAASSSRAFTACMAEQASPPARPQSRSAEAETPRTVRKASRAGAAVAEGSLEEGVPQRSAELRLFCAPGSRVCASDRRGVPGTGNAAVTEVTTSVKGRLALVSPCVAARVAERNHLVKRWLRASESSSGSGSEGEEERQNAGAKVLQRYYHRTAWPVAVAPDARAARSGGRREAGTQTPASPRVHGETAQPLPNGKQSRPQPGKRAPEPPTHRSCLVQLAPAVAATSEANAGAQVQQQAPPCPPPAAENPMHMREALKLRRRAIFRRWRRRHTCANERQQALVEDARCVLSVWRQQGKYRVGSILAALRAGDPAARLMI